MINYFEDLTQVLPNTVTNSSLKRRPTGVMDLIVLCSRNNITLKYYRILVKNIQ